MHPHWDGVPIRFRATHPFTSAHHSPLLHYKFVPFFILFCSLHVIVLRYEYISCRSFVVPSPHPPFVLRVRMLISLSFLQYLTYLVVDSNNRNMPSNRELDAEFLAAMAASRNRAAARRPVNVVPSNARDAQHRGFTTTFRDQPQLSHPHPRNEGSSPDPDIQAVCFPSTLYLPLPTLTGVERNMI